MNDKMAKKFLNSGYTLRLGTEWIAKNIWKCIAGIIIIIFGGAFLIFFSFITKRKD